MKCENCRMENAIPTDTNCWNCGKALSCSAQRSSSAILYALEKRCEVNITAPHNRCIRVRVHYLVTPFGKGAGKLDRGSKQSDIDSLILRLVEEVVLTDKMRRGKGGD